MEGFDRHLLLRNRYEKALLKNGADDRLLRSILSGAAKATRLSFPGDDQRAQIVWQTGADVIAPLYTNFVWWLLNKAKHDGLKRLYFMSRDGHILYRIAQHFKDAWGLEIELRYFCVSRQSLFYPSIIDVDQMDAKWFTWHILSDFTPALVLGRLSINPDDIQPELSACGVKDINRTLTFSQKVRFLKLFKFPKVKEKILTRSAQLNDNAIGYLKQEGFADKVPYAVVDLGWLALSQYALSRLLEKNGSRPGGGVKGYYLGLNGLFSAYKNDTANAFMFAPSNYLSRINLVQYELSEIFAATDQGRTVSYDFKDGIYKPTMIASDIADSWPVNVQAGSILQYVKNFLSVLPASYRDRVPDHKSSCAFSLFCNFPSIAEAEVYGSFIHGADIEGKRGHAIAPKVDMQGLIRALHGYFWVQGCVTRSQLIFKPVFISFFWFINICLHVLLTVVIARMFRSNK